MRRFDFKPTFRLKLLLAMIGTLVPALLVTLLIVRREANQQVEHVVHATTQRAGDAFAQIEKIRQRQLQQLGFRFANSNRWGAALQQALEGDTAFLIDQTRYELEIAGFSGALAAFSSLSGEAVSGVAQGSRLVDPAAAIPTAVIDRVFAGDTVVFGYHIVNRELYSVHPAVLQLVTQPVGILMLGLAVNDETAQSLGQALGADVCFFASDHCIANSRASDSADLEKFAVAAKPQQMQRTTTAGEPFALVKWPLPGAAATTSLVLRIPLKSVITPFATIQRAIRIIGAIMLLLATLVAVLLSRGLAKPIRELVAATTRVAGGDYDTSVPIRSRDEIGSLAHAFNQMTHGLLLKDRYKGVLDKVVSRDVADEMLKGEIKLGGEARMVTTLFADMRGFTPLSEKMEPQSVVALLNEVMGRAEAAVVEEGGVVDKYVGDEIMALFGAPMTGDDDALHAVRAAVRIKQSIGEVNAARKARGDAEINVGIGINTGLVVAGNMGSPRRLNYTVLGAPVNLAARLCSEAGRGQILISDTTLDHVRDRVTVRSLGTRNIKGISRPVEIYQVDGVEPAIQRSVTAGGLPTAMLFALLAAAPLTAQQVAPSFGLDAEAYAPMDSVAGLIKEQSPFAGGRASLFLDVFAGSRTYGMVELRVDRGEAPSDRGIDARIEQAFVRFTPAAFDLNVQAGRFVSPFGNYPQRHHSTADPFIRPPLSYDYRTTVSATKIPGGNDGFIEWKNEPELFRPAGAPPVWAAPYQIGVMAFGTMRKLSARVAVMNSSPSSEPDEWDYDSDQFRRLSLVAHGAYQFSPELRAGLSYNRAPYLAESAALLLPANRSIADYTQQLIGAEITATRGFVEIRGELLHDTWQTPRVMEDPIEVSYYLEGKFKLSPGMFAAIRFNEMRFNEIPRSNGISEPWDYTIRRWQLAGGYRVTEHFEARGELMVNDTEGRFDPADNLLSFRLSWSRGR